mmetsp:Transcript_54661/g.160774  ORF Transcript_54661/g.160774 Transcript_54661/m.160774 type:complete len:229 (-) Transcript_54661:41-727(-)
MPGMARKDVADCAPARKAFRAATLVGLSLRTERMFDLCRSAAADFTCARVGEASACLLRATRAPSQALTASMRFISSAWNSLFSFMRSVFASESALKSASTSSRASLRFCVFSFIWAEASPRKASSSAILAVPSSMALVFSFSFVSHQHTILSYISASLFASAWSSDSIFCRSPTTRLMGLGPSEMSLPQACSSELASRAPAEARTAIRRTGRIMAHVMSDAGDNRLQ